MANVGRSLNGTTRITNDVFGVCIDMEDWKEYSEDYFRRVVNSFWEAYRADFENAMRNDKEKSTEESEDDLNNNASKIHIQDS